MAKRAKAKNAKNHWRQKEYLRIGVVMLPTLAEERTAVRDLDKREKMRNDLKKLSDSEV